MVWTQALLYLSEMSSWFENQQKKPFSKKCDSKLRTHVVCMITLEVKRDQAIRDRPKGTSQKGPAKRDQDPKGPQIKLTTFYLRNKIKFTCIKFLTSIPSICAVVQFESDMHQCLVSILKKKKKKLELSPKWNISFTKGKETFFSPYPNIDVTPF